MRWQSDGAATKAVFDYHETAWSLRTTGFPIYAFAVFAVEGEDGVGVRLLKVAETQKRPFSVLLPPGFVGLVRLYASNSGREAVYIYRLGSERPEVVDDAEAAGLLAHPDPIVRAAAWRIVEGRWPDWVARE